MSKKKDGESTSRRDFLKLASVSAPAAAAAVVVGTKAEAATIEETREGMQDTAHTRAYYDSARF